MRRKHKKNEKIALKMTTSFIFTCLLCENEIETKKKFEDRMLLKKPFLPLVGTKKMT